MEIRLCKFSYLDFCTVFWIY